MPCHTRHINYLLVFHNKTIFSLSQILYMALVRSNGNFDGNFSMKSSERISCTCCIDIIVVRFYAFRLNVLTICLWPWIVLSNIRIERYRFDRTHANSFSFAPLSYRKLNKTATPALDLYGFLCAFSRIPVFYNYFCTDSIQIPNCVWQSIFCWPFLSILVWYFFLQVEFCVFGNERQAVKQFQMIRHIWRTWTLFL